MKPEYLGSIVSLESLDSTEPNIPVQNRFEELSLETVEVENLSEPEISSLTILKYFEDQMQDLSQMLSQEIRKTGNIISGIGLHLTIVINQNLVCIKIYITIIKTYYRYVENIRNMNTNNEDDLLSNILPHKQLTPHILKAASL